MVSDSLRSNHDSAQSFQMYQDPMQLLLAEQRSLLEEIRGDFTLLRDDLEKMNVACNRMIANCSRKSKSVMASDDDITEVNTSLDVEAEEIDSLVQPVDEMIALPTELQTPLICDVTRVSKNSRLNISFSSSCDTSLHLPCARLIHVIMYYSVSDKMNPNADEASSLLILLGWPPPASIFSSKFDLLLQIIFSTVQHFIIIGAAVMFGGRKFLHSGCGLDSYEFASGDTFGDSDVIKLSWSNLDSDRIDISVIVSVQLFRPILVPNLGEQIVYTSSLFDEAVHLSLNDSHVSDDITDLLNLGIELFDPGIDCLVPGSMPGREKGYYQKYCWVQLSKSNWLVDSAAVQEALPSFSLNTPLSPSAVSAGVSSGKSGPILLVLLLIREHDPHLQDEVETFLQLSIIRTDRMSTLSLSVIIYIMVWLKECMAQVDLQAVLRDATNICRSSGFKSSACVVLAWEKGFVPTVYDFALFLLGPLSIAIDLGGEAMQRFNYGGEKKYVVSEVVVAGLRCTDAARGQVTKYSEVLSSLQSICKETRHHLAWDNVCYYSLLQSTGFVRSALELRQGCEYGLINTGWSVGNGSTLYSLYKKLLSNVLSGCSFGRAQVCHLAVCRSVAVVTWLCRSVSLIFRTVININSQCALHVAVDITGSIIFAPSTCSVTHKATLMSCKYLTYVSASYHLQPHLFALDNFRIVIISQMISHQASQSCKQGERTTELSRLCTINKNHRANLSTLENLQLCLDTCFEQLKVATAIQLGRSSLHKTLWGQGYRSRKLRLFVINATPPIFKLLGQLCIVCGNYALWCIQFRYKLVFNNTLQMLLFHGYPRQLTHVIARLFFCVMVRHLSVYWLLVGYMSLGDADANVTWNCHAPMNYLLRFVIKVGVLEVGSASVLTNLHIVLLTRGCMSVSGICERKGWSDIGTVLNVVASLLTAAMSSCHELCFEDYWYEKMTVLARYPPNPKLVAFCTLLLQTISFMHSAHVVLTGCLFTSVRNELITWNPYEENLAALVALKCEFSIRILTVHTRQAAYDVLNIAWYDATFGSFFLIFEQILKLSCLHVVLEDKDIFKG